MQRTRGVILGIRVFACFIALIGLQAVLGDYYQILKEDIEISFKKADAALAGADRAALRKIEDEENRRRGGPAIKRLLTKPGIGMIAAGVLLFAVARPLARVPCGEQKEENDQKDSG